MARQRSEQVFRWEFLVQTQQRYAKNVEGGFQPTDRKGYIKWLRDCAQAWRSQPGDRQANEAQARRNEEMAADMERTTRES